MPAHDFLTDFALVLGSAGLATVLCRALGLPSLLGYLLAGLAIGPHTLFPLFADEPTVHTLAELGVILLMFGVGLEFSVGRLLRAGRVAAVVAAIEIGLMLTLGAAAAGLLGWARADAFVAGAVIAISSTMVIARAFGEHAAPPALRELVLGVLVVEDIVAILLLVFIGRGESLADGAAVAKALLRLGLFLLGSVAVGALVVPRFLRAAMKAGRPETLLVASVGLAFGAAVLARSAGYSVALGAFLAGSLAADAGAGHRLERLIRPLRDLFVAVFFVATGMQFDPSTLATLWPLILGATALVVIGKVVGVSLGAFLTGHGARLSVRAGFTMAQIGEFSFIVATAAGAGGGARAELLPVAIGTAILTAALAPWLMARGDAVATVVDRRLPPPLQALNALAGSWRAMLAGPAHGSATPDAGRVAPVLRAIGVEVLLLAGVTAGVVVNASALARWAQGALRLGADNAVRAVALGGLVAALPFLVRIARQVEQLAARLAARAIPLRPSGSMDPGRAPRAALSGLLHGLLVLVVGLPLAVLAQLVFPAWEPALLLGAWFAVAAWALWRSTRDLEGHLRASSELVASTMEWPAVGAGHDAATMELPLAELEALLPGIGPFVALELPEAAAGAGKSLGELNVRGLTGATVVAIRRPTETVVAPSSEQRLLAGDVLVLLGTADAVGEARALLGARLRAAA
ncbi:MAG: cation:proton antiporter [Gemmatimonadales bacterium]|nr:cation:proton antiporter [Gemmatimonadales bacterium]